MSVNDTTTSTIPIISIIVPVYKTEGTIKRCLNSIRMQSFPDYEVIVVNDGTPDNAIEIAREFVEGDPRFSIVSQPNKGLGAARNTGLQKARGQYIACIDSDDTIQPTMLEKMINAIKHESADMAICEASNPFFVNGEFQRSLGEYKLAGAERVISSDEALLQQLNYIEPILFNSVCFKLIKRTLFADNSVLFPEGHRYSEDTPTSIKLFLHSKRIALIHEPLYNYIHENESLTSSYSLKKARDLIKNMDEIRTAVNSSKPEIKLDNFFIGLLFPLTKQILFSKSNDTEEIARLNEAMDAIRKTYRPDLRNPAGIPLVQKIKILVSYYNLAEPICKVMSRISFIPFIKHML